MIECPDCGWEDIADQFWCAGSCNADFDDFDYECPACGCKW